MRALAQSCTLLGMLLSTFPVLWNQPSAQTYTYCFSERSWRLHSSYCWLRCPVSRTTTFDESAGASSRASVSHDLWDTGDYELFFSKVQQHIATAEAKSQLDEVIPIARLASACLMCCCPDWDHCHRKCVIEAISERTFFTYGHLQRECFSKRQRAA